VSWLSDHVAEIVSVMEGAGALNVRARPGLPLDLAEATATWLTAGGALERWTVWYAPMALHAGAADDHLELDARVVVEWGYKEAEDEYLALGEKVAAVMLALIQQLGGVDPNGIRPLETPGEPVRIETGEAAYVSQFSLHLIC
jgi:hypothetical protein